ncbi:MAG: hypothetical protein FJ004_04110 [Chloroflexi bacterium]|nr:hypothetical protein [Chloroflexota bacterium]
MEIKIKRPRKIPTTFYRAGLHAPLGALAAYLGDVPQVVLVILFLAYEISEDWRIKDHAYIDIKSFMVGYVATLIGVEVIF